MSRSVSTIKLLVAKELEAVPAPCREQLAKRLIEPRFQALSWEYGALDDTRLCCVVAEADGDHAVVYCEDGFSPYETWGAVSLREASMGSDDQWYTSLYDAAIGAGLCGAPLV